MGYKIAITSSLSMQVNFNSLKYFEEVSLHLLGNRKNQNTKKSLKVRIQHKVHLLKRQKIQKNQNTRSTWKVEVKNKAQLKKRKMFQKNQNTRNTWKVEVQGKAHLLNKLKIQLVSK